MNYIAFLFTAASIVGTLANSFQKKWCFWIWICTNSFWCIYNTINGQYAQAMLYVFNLVTCIIGLWKWQKPVQIAVDFSNGHDKSCITEYRKTKNGIDILSCKCEDGAESKTQENPLLLACAGHDEMHRRAKTEIDKKTQQEEVLKKTTDNFETMLKGISMFTEGFLKWIASANMVAKIVTEFANTANADVRFYEYKITAADKRVLHRAYNAKRYRTRKKNIARLHHEYRQYIKKGGGRK